MDDPDNLGLFIDSIDDSMRVMDKSSKGSCRAFCNFAVNERQCFKVQYTLLKTIYPTTNNLVRLGDPA